MSLKQQALQGVFWSAIEGWGRQALNAVIFFLLARLLGPETYGLLGTAWFFLSFVYIFTDQGFTNAIIQRTELDTEHLDTAFWTNMGVGVILTIVTLAGADGVALFFHQPQVAPIIRWLSASFVLVGLSNVQQAILRRQLAFRVLAVRSLLATAIGGVVGVTMALQGYGPWSLVGQHLVNSLVQVIALWFLTDWRPQWRFSKPHFHDLWSFGVNIIGIEIVNFINTRADHGLISFFLGETALGYYTLASRILAILTELLTSVMTKVAMPVFSRLQEDPDRLRQAFYQMTRTTAYVAFPIFLGVAVLAPELVQGFLDTPWLPSVPVIQALVLAGLLYAIFYFNGSAIQAAGQPRLQLMAGVVHNVVNLITFSIAVHWGIFAVAVSFVLRGYLLAPFDIWLVHRVIRLDIKTYLGQFLGAIAGGGCMVLGMVLMQRFLLPGLAANYRLIPLIISGSILYIAALRMFSPKVFAELIGLLRLLRGWKLVSKS